MKMFPLSAATPAEHTIILLREAEKAVMSMVGCVLSGDEHVVINSEDRDSDKQPQIKMKM